MDKKDIDKKIKIAIELVKDVDDQFQKEAFGAIFFKLINSSETVSADKDLRIPSSNTQNKHQEKKSDLESGKKELATNCKISLSELNDTISIKDDYIQIIAPLTGTETQKQITAAQCVLAAYEVMLKRDWVPASLLTKSLDKSGIGGLANLARNLQQNSKLFRAKGVRPYKEYKLFGPGRISAFDLIRKLSKGETLE